jgi:putative transposase
MGYDPERHHRRSIRLRGYDYSQPGEYFVTLCVQNRLCVLGEIVAGEMRLSTAGLVITSWWEDIPRRFPGSNLDAFVVMPNHLHGIVLIDAVAGGSDRVRPSIDGGESPEHDPHLARIIQWFKTMTTNDYIRGVKTDGWPPFRGRFWQRDYFEHIGRDGALDGIRRYIENNPAKWADDAGNPANPSPAT